MSTLSQMMEMMTLGSAPSLPIVSLLHFDGTNGSTTFTDETGKAWTASSSTISTAQAVFGQSGVFSTGYISTPYSTDFVLDSGDFSIEMFVRFTSLPSNSAMTLAASYFNSNGWALQYRNDAGLGNRIRFGFTDTVNLKDFAWTPSINTWYHIAACRSGGAFTVYVDGTALATPVAWSYKDGGSSNIITVGCLNYIGSKIQNFKGYLDEMRIIKGTSAYSGNFTPPVAPFTYP